MTIVARAEIRLELLVAACHGQSEDEAVAAVAARYCLPVEVVREVADEIHGEVA
jgi:hypothetical protein